MLSTNDKPALREIFRWLRAVPKNVTAVEQLYYCGDTGGSEFLTYDAGKCYIAEKIAFNNPGAPAASTQNASFYDLANNIKFGVQNLALVYNGVDEKRFGNPGELSNILFSRVGVFGLTQLYFLGYRLTIS